MVVGLPLSLDGGTGPAAAGVLDEVARLAKVVTVPVEVIDERFTTVTADRDLMQMRHAGPGPPPRHRQGRRRRAAADLARLPAPSCPGRAPMTTTDGTGVAAT